MDVDLKKKNAQMLIGRRFIALAWVIDPGLFASNPSASHLSETLHITRKADLWTLTGAAAKHFGITNRAQDHAWNRGTASPQQPTIVVNSHDSTKTAKPTLDASQGQPSAKNKPKESFTQTHPHAGSKKGRTVRTERQKMAVP